MLSMLMRMASGVGINVVSSGSNDAINASINNVSSTAVALVAETNGPGDVIDANANGGGLALNATGNVQISGTTTSGFFVGDGSQLTNVASRAIVAVFSITIIRRCSLCDR